MATLRHDRYHGLALPAYAINRHARLLNGLHASEVSQSAEHGLHIPGKLSTSVNSNHSFGLGCSRCV
jgi:hypothetical protein